MLTPTKTPSPEKSESPFVKKWIQIEKKQKRNATAALKIDNLYQTFQDDILPEEQKLVDLLAQETRHLIAFLPRKSFTQWQREELQAWIEDNLSMLSTHPFGDHKLFEAVSEEYSDFLVQLAQKNNENHTFSFEEIEYMRTMANEMFNGDKNFTDDELIEFMRDPSIFQQVFCEYMDERAKKEQESDFGDEDSTDNNDEFFEEEHFQSDSHHYTNDNQYNQQKNRKDKLKSLFNSSKLNKLYKLLANRLHPDKEANEHLKVEKSELMSKLVIAKKNKDAYTIISMFHQFMPENDEVLFDGSDEELTQDLVFLLNEKLDQLDQEHYNNQYNDSMKSMVWKKLNGRSKKATQENIDIHLADLEDNQTRLSYCINEVTTVKILKEILAERYDQRNFNPFSESEFSLEGFNDFFR